MQISYKSISLPHSRPEFFGSVQTLVHNNTFPGQILSKILMISRLMDPDRYKTLRRTKILDPVGITPDIVLIKIFHLRIQDPDFLIV